MDILTIWQRMSFSRVLAESDKHAEAYQMLETAHHDSEVLLGVRHEVTMFCSIYRGLVAIRLEKHAEGCRLLRQVLAEREKLENMHPGWASYCVSALADSSRKQGSYNEALALYEKAYEEYAAIQVSGYEDSVWCSETMESLRLFLAVRTLLIESSKEASTDFQRLMQADKHLQSPLKCRGRAATSPDPKTNVVCQLDDATGEMSDSRSEP